MIVTLADIAVFPADEWYLRWLWMELLQLVQLLTGVHVSLLFAGHLRYSQQLLLLPCHAFSPCSTLTMRHGPGTGDATCITYSPRPDKLGLPAATAAAEATRMSRVHLNCKTMKFPITV
jgi:hypothetical protein